MFRKLKIVSECLWGPTLSFCSVRNTDTGEQEQTVHKSEMIDSNDEKGKEGEIKRITVTCLYDKNIFRAIAKSLLTSTIKVKNFRFGLV